MVGFISERGLLQVIEQILNNDDDDLSTEGNLSLEGVFHDGLLKQKTNSKERKHCLMGCEHKYAF